MNIDLNFGTTLVAAVDRDSAGLVLPRLLSKVIPASVNFLKASPYVTLFHRHFGIPNRKLRKEIIATKLSEAVAEEVVA